MTREEILALMAPDVINDVAKQLQSRKRPLLEAVFKDVVFSASDTVKLVELDPSRKAVPFSEPSNPAPEYSKEKYGLNAIEIPLIKLKKFLPPSEIRKLSSLTGDGVVRTISTYIEQLKNSLYETYEVLAAKALSGSIRHALHGGGEVNIDFGTINTYTPSITWDNSSADIFKDIKAMKELISSQTSHGDFALLVGTDVMSAMLKNPDIKDWLKYTQGEKIAENGTLYRLAEVDIVEVSGTYVDADGISKAFIPPRTVYMVARTALKKVFGPPEDVNFTAATDIFVYTASQEKDPQGIEIGAHGRFLPAVLTTEAIVKATVLP